MFFAAACIVRRFTCDLYMSVCCLSTYRMSMCLRLAGRVCVCVVACCFPICVSTSKMCVCVCVPLSVWLCECARSFEKFYVIDNFLAFLKAVRIDVLLCKDGNKKHWCNKVQYVLFISKCSITTTILHSNEYYFIQNNTSKIYFTNSEDFSQWFILFMIISSVENRK